MLQQIQWQTALVYVGMFVLAFISSMFLSLCSGYFGWSSILTTIFLITGFIIIITLLPILLNLSRSFFWIAFVLLLTHVLVTIISFTLHYHESGLLGTTGKISPSFYDSLNFSIATFTTLGYGDLQPLPSYRLATSLEALLGMVSMALGISVIWLWCQENIIPKEVAYFDGIRRHKSSLGVSRIRTKTITGKERELKDWVLPAKNGESYRYDDQRQEWILVMKDTELHVNTSVTGADPHDME